MAALAAAELLIAWDWPRAAPWTASDLIPPALTIAGFALLPRRHQRPIEVFAAVVLLSLAGSAIPLHHPFAVILMALYAVAANRPRRPAIVALVTTWALFLLSYLLYPSPDHPVRVRLTSALASCLVAGILWALALRFGQQARALAEHDRRRTAAIAPGRRRRTAATGARTPRHRVAHGEHHGPAGGGCPARAAPRSGAGRGGPRGRRGPGAPLIPARGRA